MIRYIQNTRMKRFILLIMLVSTAMVGLAQVEKNLVYDGNAEVLGELVERLTERPECLTEDYIDPSHISEGVVLRIDSGTFTPTFMKSKSYPFRVMEGLCEAVDVENVS